MKGVIYMSFPNIPDVNPNISINRDEVINLLLASIAFEELGLAHIINSEGEKIQYIIGTLGGQTPLTPPTLDELLKVNKSVAQTLRSVIKNQMLLQFKLEDILDIPPEQRQIFENIATATAVFNNISVTDSDNAFYYTIGNNTSDVSRMQREVNKL
jgi:hypothetical protein